MKAKRLAALILCMALLLSLAPATALADGPEYWVGYTAITASADASGEGWVWASSAKTLTLTDAALRGADQTGDLANASAVCLPGGSTAVLAGDNTLLGGACDGSSSGSAGLWCKGALTVTGGGSLTAVGGEVKETASPGRCGIYAYGDITFDSGFTGSALAVGGDGTESGGTSYGIYADEDGSLTIAGTGSLAAVGGRSGSFSISGTSYGIKCDSLSIEAAANVTAVGGYVLAPANHTAYSYGILVDTKLQVSAAAHVTAVGGQAEVEGDNSSQNKDAFSQGIAFSQANAPSEMTLSGHANVTAIGGKGAKSYGLYADGIGSLTIDGGAVLTAVGGDVSNSQSSVSCGLLLASHHQSIHNDISVTVNSGALVAKSGNASSSYGLYFGTWNRGTAKLSLGTGTGDAVVVAYAGHIYPTPGGTRNAISNIDTTGATWLVGGNADRYVLYGEGIYKDISSGAFTHIFTAKQTAVPAAGAPFVIIDGEATPAGAGLDLAGDTTASLSGISVVIAGDTTAASTGLNCSGDLELTGSGALVCLGSNASTDSCGIHTTGSLTVDDLSDLVAVGGNASTDSFGLNVESMYSNGHMTAVGGTGAGQSAGIMLVPNSRDAVFGAGGVSAVGGTGNTGSSIGFTAGGDVYLNATSFTAVGGQSNAADSVGMNVNFSASIGSGSLRAVGGSGGSGKSSTGLHAVHSLSLGECSVACVGGHGTGGSVGAAVGSNLSLQQGALCAVGGNTGAGVKLGQNAGIQVSYKGLLSAFGGSYGLQMNDNATLSIENQAGASVISNPQVVASGTASAVQMNASARISLDNVRVKVSADPWGANGTLLPPAATYTADPAHKHLRTALPLTISGAVVADKPYDGTKTASLRAWTLNGLVPGDVVTVTPTATFATADVGTGISVTVSYALSGRDAYKYAPPADDTLQGTITPRAFTVTPPPDIPATGDNMPLLGLALLAALALCGIAVFAFRRRISKR